MNSHPIKAVLFDCDGTLVDSEPISLRVLVDLVHQRGYEIEHEVAVRRWAGCDLHEVFAEINRHIDPPLPDDFLDIFRAEQMTRLAAEVQPIDGARELVEAISLPCCVASNAPAQKSQVVS